MGVGPGLAVSVTDDAGLASPDHLTLPHDRLPEGAGIGLEIIRRIMALHRGHLDNVVEPHHRTTLRLVFASSKEDVVPSGRLAARVAANRAEAALTHPDRMRGQPHPSPPPAAADRHHAGCLVPSRETPFA